MTQETAKKFLPLIQACAEGKTIQCNWGENDWHDGRNIGFTDAPERYRIKPPEPKLREWKAEEVPVGCLVKYRAPELQNIGVIALVIGVSPEQGIRVPHGWFPFEYAREQLVHSTDGGKTYHPCGILE